ncbi:type I-E CRISPR-associated protein Cse2/CasB [Streptomyces sp. NPDC056257]|uniref:type I-E CRISPR-associated protein Cse2/CasB n=1 Tax=Streptomyces sp. NPDC056257 TaxID=3345765 RepID=UPI0035E2CBE8
MTSTQDTEVPSAPRARTRQQAFTAHMVRVAATDPGARAALRGGVRRGLNERRLREMDRLIVPWLPERGALTDDIEWAYYAVASMIGATTSRTVAAAPEEPPVEAGPGEPAPADEGPQRDRGAVPRYGTSLGVAFALAVTGGRGGREMREATAESRLNLLTRQSLTGLHRHLPGSVGYLRELNVEIDWAQLLSDLSAWRGHRGRITRRWLQDYYRLRDQHKQREARQLDAAGETDEEPAPEE